MSRPRSGLILFILLLALIALLTALSPSDAALGGNVRLVYLHGAWVWTALTAIGGAGAAGVVGLLLRRERIRFWSVALGQAGIFFWVTYLPLSLWAMQANWNGLYLDEPRWRIGVHFAVAGILLQAALVAVGSSGWASLFNALFAAALGVSLAGADAVMHPASPIFSSGSALIETFFLALLAACLLACALLARWLLGYWAMARRGPAA
jgi:hypothetical protein